MLTEMRFNILEPKKADYTQKLSERKPDWIKVPAPTSDSVTTLRSIIRTQLLVTVCEEALCPNIGECWQRQHIAFMILGRICTRSCTFCTVRTGKPKAVSSSEPGLIAKIVKELNIKHVVITSVNRDDLDDGGASQFSKVIKAIRYTAQGTTIEVLTPDFRNKPGGGEIVIHARPDVFNHNLETVPRLYPSIRPGGRYYTSLRLLERAKLANPDLFTKSGLMVGLGESHQEVVQVMNDLRTAGVDFLTIGQYLRPTLHHLPVKRYVTPDEFREYAAIARLEGFLMVAASPLTRSSYHADRDFLALRQAHLDKNPRDL